MTQDPCPPGRHRPPAAAGRADGGQEASPRKVGFYRDFRCFTGGHLKVWDYFCHVRSSPRHDALIRFSPDTVWDDSNPWYRDFSDGAGTRWEEADIWFVGGVDWLALDQAGPPGWGQAPVINLVQHVLHASPADIRYSLLDRRAIRICVSEEVADAINATGRVNGPVLAIPNGIRVDATGRPAADRDIDILVVANKMPSLGEYIAGRLTQRGRRVGLARTTIPRAQFLALLGRSRVTVFVSHPVEGFYLPALEGMALGTLVIAADCVGNRSFCHDGYNCFRPEFDPEKIVGAALDAAALDADRADKITLAGKSTALAHGLDRERGDFLAILDNVATLWNESA
jgi:hypothetical protein